MRGAHAESRGGWAYLKQCVDRPSGEPARVADSLRERSSWSQRRIGGLVEALMNNVCWTTHDPILILH
jgi:hypothetical protein